MSTRPPMRVITKRETDGAAAPSVVMIDSPEAAEYKTITVTGWVSRDGYFYGDGVQGEKAARYGGCTHCPCSRCGTPVEKSRTWCDECKAAVALEEHLKLPYVEIAYDMVTCLPDSDVFFFDGEDIEDYVRDMDVIPTHVHLVVCEPIYLTEVNPDEYLVDDLPQDCFLGDISPTLDKAFATLNEAIRKENLVLSWRPGKTRTVYTVGIEAEEEETSDASA